MPILEKETILSSFAYWNIRSYMKNATITLKKYVKQTIKVEGDYVISNGNISSSHLQRIGLSDYISICIVPLTRKLHFKHWRIKVSGNSRQPRYSKH